MDFTEFNRLCDKAVLKIPYVKLYKISEQDLPKKIQDCKTNDLTSKSEHVRDMLNAIVLLERIKVFECEKCHKCFTTAKKYTIHKLNHVAPIVRTEFTPKHGFKTRFECEECGWRFVEESTLQAHMVLHDPFPHICQCGIGYYLANDLKLHKEIVHPERRKRAWKQKINYHGPKAKSEFCVKTVSEEQTQVINRKLDTKISKLKAKTRRKYNGNNNKSYECSTCNKLFKCQRNRKIHFDAVHLGERPFTCEICNKSFTQLGALNIHLRIHAGIKNHKCNFCEKSFNSKSNKENHERIHTGEKPFACNYCVMKFSDPSALKRHIRLHTGEKPYSCEKCHMRFSDNSAFRGHKKRQSCIKFIGWKKRPRKYEPIDVDQ